MADDAEEKQRLLAEASMDLEKHRMLEGIEKDAQDKALAERLAAKRKARAGVNSEHALIEALFKKYDKDGNGQMDGAELMQFMIDCGLEPDEDRALEVLEMLDSDDDLMVSLAEFKKEWETIKLLAGESKLAELRVSPSPASPVKDAPKGPPFTCEWAPAEVTKMERNMVRSVLSQRCSSGEIPKYSISKLLSDCGFMDTEESEIDSAFEICGGKPGGRVTSDMFLERYPWVKGMLKQASAADEVEDEVEEDVEVKMAAEASFRRKKLQAKKKAQAVINKRRPSVQDLNTSVLEARKAQLEMKKAQLAAQKAAGRQITDAREPSIAI